MKNNYAFIPHIGIGDANLIRVCLPEILYNNSIPILLFDRLYVDKSIDVARESGNEFEFEILDELKRKKIIELKYLYKYPLYDEKFYLIYNKWWEKITGKPIVNLKKSKFCIEKFFKEAKKENINYLDVHNDIFTECYGSLMVCKDNNIPIIDEYINKKPYYQDIIEIILENDKKILSKDYETIKILNHTYDLYGPSNSILVGDDNRPFHTQPILPRKWGYKLVGSTQQLSEKKSWKALEHILELRNEPLLKNFRYYVHKLNQELKINSKKKQFNKEIIKKHKLKLCEIELAIIQEFERLQKFIKITSILSIPSSLFGLLIPESSVIGTSFATLAISGEISKKIKIHNTEQNIEFYKKHKEYQWYLFYINLKKKYGRNTLKNRLIKYLDFF